MGKQEEKTSSTYSLRISENAYQNIDDIAEFIAFINHQPQNAIMVVDGIDLIQLNPFVYKECAELKTITKIYRQVLYKSWLIIFKIKGIEIVILGVIYGGRHSKKIKPLKKIK